MGCKVGEPDVGRRVRIITDEAGEEWYHAVGTVVEVVNDPDGYNLVVQAWLRGYYSDDNNEGYEDEGRFSPSEVELV